MLYPWYGISILLLRIVTQQHIQCGILLYVISIYVIYVIYAISIYVYIMLYPVYKCNYEHEQNRIMNMTRLRIPIRNFVKLYYY